MLKFLIDEWPALSIELNVIDMGRLMRILIFFVLLAVSCYTHGQRVSAITNGNITEKIRELNEQSSILNRDSTSKALTYAHEAYLLAMGKNDNYWQAVSLLNLSEGYLYNDSYDQALDYANTALSIFSKMKNDSGVAQANTLIGWIFYDTENPNISLEYHRKALLTYESGGMERKAAYSMNAIGLVFQLLGKNDSAFHYFKKALALSEKNQMTAMTSAILNNIGICKNTAGNYSEAASEFQKALSLALPLDDELRTAEILNQMAFSYIRLKDYRKADSLLTASRTLIDHSNSNSRKEKLMDNLHTSALLNEAKGNYKSAFSAIQQYMAISNEIISRNKSEVVIAEQLKRETHLREMQIKDLEAQQKLRSFQLYASIAGIFLLVVIAFLAYSRLKNKREKERQIEHVRQLTIQKKLETAILEQEALHSKIEFKNLNLKDLALHVEHNRELIRQFLNDLGAVSSKIENKSLQLEFTKMIRDFSLNYENNTEAQRTTSGFGDAHSDFIYNLLKKFPDLTENEQRLCAQIRMNLSSKQIASLNNISVKSVEMARYRLRKHFGLQQKVDLNDFLRSV